MTSHIPKLPVKYRKLDEAGLLDALGVIADDVEGARARLDGLLDERLAVMGALAERGVSNRVMAERMNVTQWAVAFALRPPERKRGRKTAKTAAKKAAAKSA